MSRHDMLKISKEIARELGVSAKVLRIFLLGQQNFSLFMIGREDIRRSLIFADEALGHKEHNHQIPAIMFMLE